MASNSLRLKYDEAEVTVINKLTLMFSVWAMVHESFAYFRLSSNMSFFTTTSGRKHEPNIVKYWSYVHTLFTPKHALTRAFKRTIARKIWSIIGWYTLCQRCHIRRSPIISDFDSLLKSKNLKFFDKINLFAGSGSDDVCVPGPPPASKTLG